MTNILTTLSRTLAVVAGVCGAFIAGNCTAEQRVRTWTDDTGNHEVEATFVEYEDGNVVLLKSDGSEIAVPLERLSSSDRGYVQYELRRRAIDARNEQSSLRKSVSSGKRDGEIERKSEGSPDALPVASDVQELFGVNWHAPVESAFQTARAGQREQKPVMWFRVLGDLSGFM